MIKIYLCANKATSREESPEKLPSIASTRGVKRLRFWYQTLKFSHPINVKFPRQSFAVITVKNVRQICENPFTDISRTGKASGTQDFFREVGEDLFYMTVNHKRPSWELHIWAGKLQSLTPEMHTLDVI